MYSITRDIIFTTNEYLDNPISVYLAFTEEDLEMLKQLIELADTHDIIIQKEFATREVDTDPEWVIGYDCVKIHPGGFICYYAQGKHDASVQIESSGFLLKDLKKEEDGNNN